MTGEEIKLQRTEDALAQSQAQLAAILEAAVEAIISIDEKGIIQTVNASAERLFGYTAAEMLGRNVAMLMPEEYAAEHDAHIARYLRTGVKKIIGIGREVVGRRRDGTTFPMDLSVAEARRGGRRHFVGIARDITERKQAQEALHRSHEELKRAIAALEARNDEVRSMTQQLWHSAKLASVGELAASIAHELNNPLATVSLRIESVLAKTEPTDPRRKSLEIIEQETRRMADLVSNVLQFSRRGHDQVSTVDVRQELTKAVELVQHLLRKHQIEVVQEFANETPTIYADRQKLRQVFLNLLTNAADAMPKGGNLTLRASTTTLEGNRPGVVIEVIDTGVGILAEHLDRVMEPFFTTKEEGHGTGLGLAICRRVIQEHQGALQISSQVGQGTTVRILLPIRYSDNTEHLRK